MATPDDPKKGWGTSFADPGDILAFKRCKARGGSDNDCFKVGDNGIGFWGDNCAQGSGPSVAVIPEDMIEKWGSMRAAHNKLVRVFLNGHYTFAHVRDRMPHRSHVTNHAVLDMNPDTCAALGVGPGKYQIVWRWATEDEVAHFGKA
jgi:hypothetical protein